MPNLNNPIEAKKLAKFMQKLANHLEEVERANNTRESELHRDRESSMYILRNDGFDTGRLIQLLESHYALQFNTYGENEVVAAQNIIKRIKKDLLETIIDTPSTLETTKNYLRRNLEVLSGLIESYEYNSILTTARGMLNDLNDSAHIAWRNFDTETLSINASYKDECFTNNSSRYHPYKKLLAYCYLAIKVDNPNIQISDESRKNLWIQLIDQLSSARRAHNLDNEQAMADTLDRPSCLVGITARLYFSLKYIHPLFIKLKSILNDHVNNYSTTCVSLKLGEYSTSLTDETQKRQAAESINTMSSVWLTDIIEDEEAFAPELLETHLKTLNSIGIDVEKLKIIISSQEIDGIFTPQPQPRDSLFPNIPRNISLSDSHLRLDYHNILIIKKEIITDTLIQLQEKIEAASTSFNDDNNSDLKIMCYYLKKTIEKIENLTENRRTPNYVSLFQEKPDILFLLLKIQNKLLDPLVSCPQIVRRIIPSTYIEEVNEVEPLMEHEHNNRSHAVEPDQTNTIFQRNFNAINTGIVYFGSGDLFCFTLGAASISETGPYSNSIRLPNIPVIHPYNPTGNSDTYFDHGHVSFPIVVKFNFNESYKLPNGVRELLTQHNIGIQGLEIGFCVQNMPWVENDATRTNEQLLFRPHNWLVPDAPKHRRNYNVSKNILAGTMNINNSTLELTSTTVSVHSDGPLAEIIFSPENMQIPCLDDLTKNHALYSFCIDPETGRAILTLHWLLNEEHFLSLKQHINQLMNHNHNLTLEKLTNISIAENYWGIYLEQGYNPLNCLMSLFGIESPITHANDSPNLHTASQATVMPDVASSSSNYQPTIVTQTETSSSSNIPSQSNISIRNVISRISEDKILEQINEILIAQITNEITRNPVILYGEHFTSSMQIFEESSIQTIINNTQNKREHYELLNNFFDPRERYDLEYLMDILNSNNSLIATIQEYNQNILFFDEAHNLMGVLHGENQFQLAREILIHSDGEGAIIPAQREQLLIAVITKAIINTKMLLQRLDAITNTTQIRNPINNVMCDINDIRSARLFVDIILLVINYWKEHNLDDNLRSLTEEYDALSEQINLLNANPSRLIAAENALMNIIRNPNINAYEGLTENQIQYLRNFIIPEQLVSLEPTSQAGATSHIEEIIETTNQTQMRRNILAEAEAARRERAACRLQQEAELQRQQETEARQEEERRQAAEAQARRQAEIQRQAAEAEAQARRHAQGQGHAPHDAQEQAHAAPQGGLGMPADVLTNEERQAAYGMYWLNNGMERNRNRNWRPGENKDAPANWVVPANLVRAVIARRINR